jgi:hypothetical protein
LALILFDYELFQELISLLPSSLCSTRMRKKQKNSSRTQRKYYPHIFSATEKPAFVC